jgi:membrane-bound metal-dependent hydrolase YbcI (DUF457 family)
MFIGHFAPAIAAATLPKAPRLGTLLIAAQLVDYAFFLFVLSGMEKMRITPGITVMNPMDLYHMPYTHSLLGTAVFAAAMAGIYGALTKNTRGAAIVCGVVISHWFLDVLVHAPDMTITGRPPKLGLGLWNYPYAEMPIELGITGIALWIYARRFGRAVLKPLGILAAVLFVLQLYNWFSPPPKVMDTTLPIMAITAFALFTWLAYRTDSAKLRSGP